MKHVYIAGPYRGINAWHVELNVQAAERRSMEIAEAGCLPVCPHTMFRHFNGTLSDRFWLEATMSLLERCDGVAMVIPTASVGFQESAGSVAELAWAKNNGLPVFASDCLPTKEWINGEP